MREIIDFDFHLRRERLEGKLRYFTEDELKRIEEILGVERYVYEFKYEGYSIGWNRINVPSDWFRRPYLVVSQKFKRFCDTKKFKLNFHPVELT